MISSTSPGSAAASVGRRRVAREQRRRHHVDPDVGRLRRQDRRRQQLERVAVVELAHRVRVRLGEAPGDLAGPALRRARADRSAGASAPRRPSPRSLRTRRGPIVDGDAPPEITRTDDGVDRPRRRRCSARRRAADGRYPLSDHLRLELEHGGRPGFAAADRSASRRPRRLRPARGDQRRPHRRDRRRPGVPRRPAASPATCSPPPSTSSPPTAADASSGGRSTPAPPTTSWPGRPA